MRLLQNRAQSRAAPLPSHRPWNRSKNRTAMCQHQQRPLFLSQTIHTRIIPAHNLWMRRIFFGVMLVVVIWSFYNRVGCDSVTLGFHSLSTFVRSTTRYIHNRCAGGNTTISYCSSFLLERKKFLSVACYVKVIQVLRHKISNTKLKPHAATQDKSGNKKKK